MIKSIIRSTSSFTRPLCSIQVNADLFRKAKILCIAGSSRKGSFNMKLLQCAGTLAAKKDAMDVTILDLNDYDLPLFSEDIKIEDLPEPAMELKKLFIETDGFIFACPEYNGTMTPLLNNVIAWMSRPFSQDEKMYAAFKGKFALLLSTSPGALGGIRGLAPVSQMLSFVGVNVIANQVGVGGSYTAFDEEGNLTNEKSQRLLEDAVEQLTILSLGKANRLAAREIARGFHAQYGHIDVHQHHPTTAEHAFTIHQDRTDE